MDSTLLGALIGAGAAIAGSIVTAITTYHISKRIEGKRLKTAKTEELFYVHQELHAIINKLNGLLAINSSAPTIYARSSLNKKDELIEKIKLLTQLYFNELIDHYEEAFSNINETFRSVTTNHIPNIGHSKSSVEKMEYIKHNILTRR